jgi:hypothetical protein
MDEKDFTAEDVLHGASDVVVRRRLLEVEDLDFLAMWAVLHSSDPTEGLEGPERRYALLTGDVLVQLGGEGTPKVQDFCLGEIALARGTSVGATTGDLADRLDLEYRLPQTLAVLRTGRGELRIAKQVARRSRHLPLAVVGVVDRAIARMIATESGGRILDTADAKIIEADPALHEERVEVERRRRYVSTSRTDEFGLRMVIARIEAGDVAWIEATLSRVAQIIAPLHPDATPDELRAIAFGYLARPAELLQLLLEHSDEQGELDLDLPVDEDAIETQKTVTNRAMAMPADLLDALREMDLTPLAPKAVLYLHLHEAAVNGDAAGVARVEGLGPRTYASLAELLARTDLVVKPVIDLSNRIRLTAYEHPESLKERVHLTTNGDYWPYATSTSRKVDFDHPIPWGAEHDIRGGPSTQTGTHNSGPLGRRHHRWKTHAGYRARQCGAGRYVWLTPHGLGFLVDHRGTRPISNHEAQLILDAPVGVDIYPA